MATATWNGTVIARSDDTVVVEGNHYFPRESVNAAYLLPSATTTVRPWKGTANYFSLEVAGKQNPDAAWYYVKPKEAAAPVRSRTPGRRAALLCRRRNRDPLARVPLRATTKDP